MSIMNIKELGQRLGAIHEVVDEGHRLILPIFYSYPFADGETPLDVMTRWAQQAGAQELPPAGNAEASAEARIVESSVQPPDSTAG